MTRSRPGAEDDPAGDLAMLRRYARALTRDETAADDVVQDALLRAWERRGDFRGGSWRGWLMTIVRNTFLSTLRKDRARGRLSAHFAEVLLDRQPPDQEQAVWLRQVAQSFAALPDPQREVLHLVAVEGLGYQDAAAMLGVPVGTVMSRLARARAALRQTHAAPAAPSLRLVGDKDDA